MIDLPDLGREYPHLFKVIGKAGPLDGMPALADLRRLYMKQYKDGQLDLLEVVKSLLDDPNSPLHTEIDEELKAHVPALAKALKIFVGMLETGIKNA